MLTVILLVSHPFRTKTRNGWGTQFYGKSKNARVAGEQTLHVPLRFPGLNSEIWETGNGLAPASMTATGAGRGTRFTPFGLTAVPQLLYPELTAIKWHFSQENDTLLDAGKGM